VIPDDQGVGGTYQALKQTRHFKLQRLLHSTMARPFFQALRLRQARNSQSSEIRSSSGWLKQHPKEHTTGYARS